jgi:hypothetical protein
MPVSEKKVKVKAKAAVSKFPLRLMPSVRRGAENFSEKEGVSLNQFINVAVAEKLAHLEHEAWLRRRGKSTPESRAKALAILDRPTGNPPEPGDELPKGYNSIRRKSRRRVSGQ